MMKPLLPCLLIAALAAGCAPSSDDAPQSTEAADAETLDPAQHATAIETWRAQRLQRLQAADGWLSLVGLHWIEPGLYVLGSDEASDVVFAVGPPRLGTLELNEGDAVFTPADTVETTSTNGPISGPIAIAPNRGADSRIGFDGGRASFELIERNGRHALRVRDADAATRTGFTGIPHYPVDITWRFLARFEAHPPGHTLDIVNVLGQAEAMANPGRVVFERDARRFSLEAVDDGGKQLWAIFADRSNRNETYGGGRFIYFDRPVDGTTEVDLNRAYNPPCAFTDHSTCPLPPPENRLDLEVSAGEKRYLRPDGAPRDP
jgi:uncharacterized protein